MRKGSRKNIRIIASLCVLSMMANVAPVVNAQDIMVEGSKGELKSYWGKTEIAVGKDLALVADSTGKLHLETPDIYDTSNFDRMFNGKLINKVSIPPELALNNSYALAVTDSGNIEGFNFNTDDLKAHYDIIQQAKKETDVIDVKTIDNKYVALKSDGTLGLYEKASEQIQVNNQYVTEPVEPALSWDNISKVDLNEDYILGVTEDNRMVYSNNNNMSYEITSEDGIDIVEWKNNWEKASFSDEIEGILNEATSLEDIIDADGNDNFVVYVRKDGTCDTIGAEIYGIADEIREWTDIKTVQSYSSSNKAIVVGVKNDGGICVTTNGASLVTSNDSSILEAINNIDSADDVVLDCSDYLWNIIIKNKDLSYTVLSSANSSWAKIVDNKSYDAILPPKREVFFEDGQRKVKFSLDESYDITGYKLDVRKSNENDYTSVDNIFNLDSDTAFVYRINKITENGVYESKEYRVQVSLSDNPEVIVPDIDTGVVSKGQNVKLKVQHNGIDLDGFKIKYAVAKPQKNNIIEDLEGKSINDTFEPEVDSWFKGLDVKEYNDEDGIDITESTDIFAWTEEISTGNIGYINHLRYSVIVERPNKYPEEEYKSILSESERNDALNGYRVLRRNSMIVKTGSYMTAGLSTNGEVWASRLGNINIPDIDLPVSDNIGDTSENGMKSARMWRMISDIAVGESHIAALKLDGTVIASGNNAKGQCNVSEWKDIVDIAAGKDHTVGLKKDGSVLGTISENGDVEDYGQTSFGTWGYKYNDSLSEEENKELEKQNRIIAIEANNNNTIGLRNNGKVVVAGNNDSGQCNVDGWEDIVDIAMGTRHSVGLRSDGTVVAVGDNGNGQCNVSGWKNVVQISASAYETVGITYDGKILSTLDGTEGAIYIYGDEESLYDDQPALERFLHNPNSEDLDTYKSFRPVIKSINDTSVEYCDYNSNQKINVYSKIREMIGAGIKFKYVCSGNYMTILIDEHGLVYNIIHSTAPDNPSDYYYPMLQLGDDINKASLINGPTIISNYDNGEYNKSLDIKLSSTVGEDNNILWSFDNTDVYAMGTNSNTLTFDGASILNVAPYKVIGGIKIYYPEIKYYYTLDLPEVQFSSTGLVPKGTKIAITNTRPYSYNIYYTLDSSTPDVTVENGEFILGDNTFKYDGAIEINETTVIKAIAVDKNGNRTQDLQNKVFVSEETATGTIIEANKIAEDTVLTLEGSPYSILSDLTIESGATLTIEPGVELQFASGKGLTVNGSLVAVGEQNKEIKFTGKDDDMWNGITINSQSGNEDTEMRYIEIEKASTALNVSTESSRFKGVLELLNIHDCDNGVSVNTSNMDIRNSIIRDCKNGYGLLVNCENIEVSDNVIDGNSIGLNINNTLVNVKGNAIKNNESYGILFSGGAIKDSSNINILNNEISGNYKINSETGIKSGYNVGSIESTEMGNTTFKLSSNYWGKNIEKGNMDYIKDTLNTSNEKLAKYSIEEVYWEGIPAILKVEKYDDEHIKVVRNGGTANDVYLVIGEYTEGGALSNLKIIKGIIPQINDTEEYNLYEYPIGDKEIGKQVRVFVWSNFNDMVPMYQ